MQSIRPKIERLRVLKSCRYLFLISITFLAFKLLGNLNPCIPSVLAIFADTPIELRCGSSNPNIVEIGSMKTTRFSYQPNISSFDNVFSQVTTTVTGEADVVMNFRGITVDSDIKVAGRYYTQEYYDGYDNLIESNSRFEPFDPGNGDNGSGGNGIGMGPGGFPDTGSEGTSGASGFSVFPNSISSSQFHLDTAQGANSGCLNSYSVDCLDDTYAESTEFNPDLKSIPIDNSSVVDYSQSDYSPPESVQIDAEPEDDSSSSLDNASSGNPANISSTKSSALAPEVGQWKLQKTIESFNNFNAAYERSKQSTKQFEEERKAVFNNYKQHIENLSNHAQNLKVNYEAALNKLDKFLEDYSSPPFTRQANEYYSLPTQFEYHQLDGQARQILESQLENALTHKNAREYARVASKLMNANDYDLSRAKIRVNDSGILNSDLFNPGQPKNSLDALDLSKIPSAHNRELLRTVANKFQAHGIELKGMEAAQPEQILMYAVGTELLNNAVKSAESGKIEDFLTYLDGSMAMLESSAKFSAGMASGLGNKLVDKIMEIPELAILVYENFDKIPTTQEDWVKFSKLVVRAGPQFKQAIVDGVIQYQEDFLYGDEFRKGEIVGYIIGEAVDTFVPAGRITSVTKILQKSDDIIKMSKMADMLSPDLVDSIKLLPRGRSPVINNYITDFSDSGIDFIKNNPSKVLDSLIQITDEDTLYVFDKLLASTRTFDGTKLGKDYGIIKPNQIFSDNLELSDAIARVSNFSQKLNNIEGVSVSGYASRFTETKHLSLGESPLDAHIGNLVFPGRYGLGGSKGVDAISYGLAKDELNSIAISKLEIGVDDANIHLYSQAGKTVAFDNVLDLTIQKNRDLLGLELKDIVSDNYFITQSIGALAQKKGFSGILAPSAKNLEGKIDGNSLHMFGTQKLP